MQQHTIELSRFGRTLVSKNLARNLRGEIEVRINRGESVAIDFTDVSVTTQFVAVLLGGLPQFLVDHDADDVALYGMSEPIRRKVTLALENPSEARRPFCIT